MKTLFFTFMLCVSASLFAHDLNGTVVNQDNERLEDVYLFNQRTSTAVYTDHNGNFKLEDVEVGDIIMLSYIGFKNYTLTITEKDLNRIITISLEQANISLTQVQITPEVNTLNKFVDVDIKTNPVKSSQELMRKVPGVIIGQHAGGGKAEQIFLRGFDVDHGTDVAIGVDGMPVNMVSHAHGQGYADLHFLIPETVDNINFGKGPYTASVGNFNTAGYLNFKTKKRIEESSVSLEYGQFETLRTVGVFNVLDDDNHSAYVAGSLNLTDGPFESSQNFNRYNVMAKYNYRLPQDQELTLTMSHFTSKWDASGQIPQRAVDQGLIGRFGAIDDTEGGQTSRTNINIEHTKYLTDTKTLSTNAFYSKYDFELFSNFTFFLEDPENGDQIRQFEDRNLYGFKTVLSDKFYDTATNFEYQAGFGLRYDNADDVQLSRTKNRKELLERLAFGDVDETNIYGFLNTEFEFGDFKLNPGLRLDYFKFDYVNNLTETYDNASETKLTASPKLNLIYTPTNTVQLFAKTGIGFHSNDTRVVTANNGEDILPLAYGADLGGIFKITDNLVFNTALWYLFLEQEFVYVGDAAIVEPSGKTRRLGIDAGLRYEPLSWLYLYSDINYTYARSINEPEGQDYIPLAPDFTSTGGITIQNLNGFSGGLNYRYLDDRAANEDDSIVAEGYFVTDANINYTYKNYTFGIAIENLLDTEWNETQFATESRLQNEVEPVEEIHFTPGTPFFLRGKVTVTF